MLNVETVKIENNLNMHMNLLLGLEESKLLDNIIEKILNDPYLDEVELKFEQDERIFLMSLARKIGKSGIRQYIESENK